jgi:H+/Cl- antiporter ClcA
MSLSSLMGKSFNGPLLTFPKVEAMDEKTSRLIEYTIEGFLVAWLGYLFLYQNYLLYHWHRGLPLPSRFPFVVAGIILGALFFWYEWSKFGRELEKRNHSEAAVPVVSKDQETYHPSDNEGKKLRQ